MRSRIRRPPSVWLAQAALASAALFWLYSSARTTARVGGGIDTFVVALRVVVLVAGVLLMLVVPVWGMARRKAYGRWLGVLALALIWAYLSNGQLRVLTGEMKLKHTPAPGAFPLFVTLNALLNLSIAALALRLAFAKRVSEFFGRGAGSA